MARSVLVVRPPSQHQATVPPGPPAPLAPHPRTYASVNGDGVQIAQLANADAELLMMPRHYEEDRNDIGEDARWRTDDDGNAGRCWKTTMVYQHIGEHPNVVRFLRPDEWTWLPVLANPGGPNLQQFLETNRDEMYEQRDGDGDSHDKSTACARVKPTYLNLIYQWTLHLARALDFLHSDSFEKPSPKLSLAFGDLSVEACWLNASGLKLSILGFLQSTFRTGRTGPYVGMIGCSGQDFQPLECGAVPTLETDVFLWRCVVYELMTGYWPGEGQGLAYEEKEALMASKKWPGLEVEFLGEVVRGCWTGEIKSAKEVLGAVRDAVRELGVVVGDDDEIVDLDIDGLIM